MNFGKLLKLIRLLKGVKQKELAKNLEISANYLSLVEGDKREPSLSFIKNVSRVLDVPTSFLFMDDIDVAPLSAEQNEIFKNIKNLLIEFQSLKIYQDARPIQS